MTAWLDAVKEAFAKLRKTNPKATLAEAMKEAKKTYAPPTPKAKKTSASSSGQAEKDRSVSPMSKKS